MSAWIHADFFVLQLPKLGSDIVNDCTNWQGQNSLWWSAVEGIAFLFKVFFVIVFRMYLR